MPSGRGLSCIWGMVCFLLVLFPSHGTAQESIVERQPPGDAIQPEEPRAYEPCSGVGQSAPGMCLEERLAVILGLSEGELESTPGDCGLRFPGGDRPRRFRCGEILVATRLSETSHAWRKILEITGTENTEEWAHPRLRLIGLQVSPGTERFALFNILFHPGVLWAGLNWLEEPQSATHR